MNLAIIAPTKFLKDFSSQGDCHMILAQEVLKNKAYQKYYAKEAKYKILDNGLFERGEGLDYDRLLKAAKLIKADEIVLRDDLYDDILTIRDALAMHHYFINAGASYAYLAVPQGRNKKEWLKSYQELSELPFVRTIGLSKLSIPHCWKMPISEARVACIRELFKQGIFAKNKVHHLLGGSNLVYQELDYYNKHGYGKWINSIDTSAPYVYGSRELLLDRKRPILVEEKVDFKDDHVEFPNYVHKNIQLLREVAHDN